MPTFKSISKSNKPNNSIVNYAINDVNTVAIVTKDGEIIDQHYLVLKIKDLLIIIKIKRINVLKVAMLLILNIFIVVLLKIMLMIALNFKLKVFLY